MQIQETAFVVSTHRSYHEDVSKDPYAKLWNNPKTDLLIPSILENVSEHEALMHSLRNRYFYEQINSFFTLSDGGTLLNFGAGFSMYQFVLPNTVSTIEIDKTAIIDYKKEKTDKWMDKGILPKRDIQYAAIDFNKDTVTEIVAKIKSMITKEPTFIVLEGVLFFLNQYTSQKLFDVFKNIQKKRDLMGSVSYLPEVEDTEVYHRLLHYFDSNNMTNDSFSHQTIPHSYYDNIEGYVLQEHIDEFSLCSRYAPRAKIKNKTQILNENMYLLQKT